MPQRRCLHCRALGPCHCARHLKAIRNQQAHHNAALVNQWRRQHGNWCQGWGVPPHTASDLTAAHTTPLASGTTTLADRVLCRACNTRQGTRMWGGSNL